MLEIFLAVVAVFVVVFIASRTLRGLSVNVTPREGGPPWNDQVRKGRERELDEDADFYTTIK